jgi:hypothetical protein
MPPETRLARPLVSMLMRPGLKVAAPPTITIATTIAVHFKLQRRAAKAARPAISAAKLDCEKVGTSPIQRTKTSAVSRTRSRRSRAHNSADIATTATNAKYLP